MTTRSVLFTDEAFQNIIDKKITDPKNIIELRSDPKNSRIKLSASNDSKSFTSKCCKMFAEYHEGKYLCTGCGKKIKDLEDGERFKHSETTNASQNAINAELTMQLTWNLQRIANDPTYELTSVKCSMCNHFMRFTRDLNGEGLFVCTGCRDVARHVQEF